MDVVAVGMRETEDNGARPVVQMAARALGRPEGGEAAEDDKEGSAKRLQLRRIRKQLRDPLEQAAGATAVEAPVSEPQGQFSVSCRDFVIMVGIPNRRPLPLVKAQQQG